MFINESMITTNLLLQYNSQQVHMIHAHQICVYKLHAPHGENVGTHCALGVRNVYICLYIRFPGINIDRCITSACYKHYELVICF